MSFVWCKYGPESNLKPFASYYKQLFADRKMYNYKIKTSFVSPEGTGWRDNKTGFNIIIVHFYVHRKRIRINGLEPILIHRILIDFKAILENINLPSVLSRPLSPLISSYNTPFLVCSKSIIVFIIFPQFSPKKEQLWFHLLHFCILGYICILKLNKTVKYRGGRGHLPVYYTSPQSFIITYSLLFGILWTLNLVFGIRLCILSILRTVRLNNCFRLKLPLGFYAIQAQITSPLF